MDVEYIKWDEDKNILLKKWRQISFNDVLQAIEDGKVLYIGPHHNQDKYTHQYILIVNIEDYAYVTPFIIDDDRGYIFLKTIYPSRRATEIYITNI